LNVIQLLGSTLGLGLVSGINLYATVLVVGLGIRTGLIVLRPELHQLDVLANPVVIAVAGVVFAIEFLADKIQWIDSVWDAVHTFIRPLGAAFIGVAAVGETSPEAVVVALLCGGVALSGHSTKAGLRLVVNHSPEPFSNIALSFVEDGLVVVGTYVAIEHPYLMLIVVVLFLAGFCWFAPRAFRLIRIESNAIFSIFKRLFVKSKQFFLRDRVNVRPQFTNDEMPVDYVYHLRDEIDVPTSGMVIRCAAGKGIRKLRHSIGYLNINSDEMIFVCKRFFRLKTYVLPHGNIEHVHFKKHLLIDRLTFRVAGKAHVFYLFKDAAHRGEAISKSLRANYTVLNDVTPPHPETNHDRRRRAALVD
jgi:Domain of unknown function (DUF4126)